MSDVENLRPGMCAAYGCPLLGTVGEDGKWYCFCHVRKPHQLNDAITTAIKARQYLADCGLDIRRFYGTDDWAGVYRGIQNSLTKHQRPELKRGKTEGVKAWLSRLEAALIADVAEIGKQQNIGSVIGPTEAQPHFSETA